MKTPVIAAGWRCGSVKSHLTAHQHSEKHLHSLLSQTIKINPPIEMTQSIHRLLIAGTVFAVKIKIPYRDVSAMI